MGIIKLTAEQAEKLRANLDGYGVKNPEFLRQFPAVTIPKPDNYFGATSDVEIPNGLSAEQFKANFIDNFDPDYALSQLRSGLDRQQFAVRLSSGGLSPHENVVELADVNSRLLRLDVNAVREGNTITLSDPHDASNIVEIRIDQFPNDPMRSRLTMNATLSEHGGLDFQERVSAYTKSLGLDFKKVGLNDRGVYSSSSTRSIDAAGIGRIVDEVEVARTNQFESNRIFKSTMDDVIANVGGGDAVQKAVAQSVVSNTINLDTRMDVRVPPLIVGQPDPLDAHYTMQQRETLKGLTATPGYADDMMLQLQASEIRNNVFEGRRAVIEKSRFGTLVDHEIKEGRLDGSLRDDMVDGFADGRNRAAADALNQARDAALMRQGRDELAELLKQPVRLRSSGHNADVSGAGAIELGEVPPDSPLAQHVGGERIGSIGKDIDKAAEAALDVVRPSALGKLANIVEGGAKVLPAVGAVMVGIETLGMGSAAHAATVDGRLSEDGAAEYAAMTTAYFMAEFDPTFFVGGVGLDEWFDSFEARHAGDPDLGIPGLTAEDIEGMRPQTFTEMFRNSGEHSPSQKLFGSYHDMLSEVDLDTAPDGMKNLMRLGQEFEMKDQAYMTLQSGFMPDILAVQTAETEMYAAAEAYEMAFATMDLATLDDHVNYIMQVSGLDLDSMERLDDPAYRMTVVSHFEETNNNMGLGAIALWENSQIFLEGYEAALPDQTPEPQSSPDCTWDPELISQFYDPHHLEQLGGVLPATFQLSAANNLNLEPTMEPAIEVERNVVISPV